MTDKKQYKAAYDFIRILATLLVVWGHSTYLTITTNFGGIDYPVPQNVSEVYRQTFFSAWFYMSAWVYRFHIPLFFMLAGSVFAINPVNKFKDLVIKKTHRLLIPFFLTGLFFMIPLKTWGGFFDSNRLFEIVRAFLTGHESGHLWFLSSLFWCFIVFFLLKTCLKKDFLVFLSALLLYLFYTDLPEGFFDFGFSMQYLVFFVIGFLFDKAYSFFQEHTKLNFFLFPFLLVLNILDTQRHFLPAIGFMLAGCLLFYNIAFCLTALFERFAQTSVLKKIAKQTFNIYLFHDPLMIVILYFCMQAELLSTKAGCWTYFFCRTIGVVLLSVLIGIFIEKGSFYVKSFINHRRSKSKCEKA